MPEFTTGMTNTQRQALVDGEAAGTTFTFQAGTHSGFKIETRNANQYVGAAGTILDGGGTTDRCIYGYAGKDNVVIRGVSTANPLEIKNYTTFAIDGRISGQNRGVAWTLKDFYIHNIQGTTEASGVNAAGSWVVQRGEFHDCSFMAFRNTGTNSLYEDLHIHDNGNGGDPDRAGFSKLAQTTSGTVIRRLNAHDCHRVIWLDCQAGRDAPAVVEFCTFKDCDNPINHEVSRALIVRSNLFVRCGQSGTAFDEGCIWIRGSGGFQLSGNRFYNCIKPFGCNQMGRWATTSCEGEGTLGFEELNKVEDCSFDDNEVWMLSGNGARITGLIHPDDSFKKDPKVGGPYYNPYANGNNVWTRNKYHIANDITSPKFEWWSGANPTGVNSSKTFAQWQALGQDVGGSLDFFPAASPPAEPSVPGEAEPPPEPGPEPEPGPGTGPIPASVRVGSQTIMPVQPRF